MGYIWGQSTTEYDHILCNIWAGLHPAYGTVIRPLDINKALQANTSSFHINHTRSAP